ncbi:helix-turn-helix domain-containing protein [Thermoproteota archaeon]
MKKWDYGNFAIIESIISIEKLEDLVRDIKANCEVFFSLENYEIESPAGSLRYNYEYDSGDNKLNIPWFFKLFSYSPNITVSHNGPLFSPNLPLFRDASDSISHVLNIDRSRSYSNGILFCLPNYYARIREVRIGPKELSLLIEPKAEKIDNIVAKCSCSSGNLMKQVDFEISDCRGRVFIGFRPEAAFLGLISRPKNELLDKREFHSSWGLPKDVIIDIPEFEIKQLIEQGESKNVEFKRRIESRPGDVKEFLESIVSFANSDGGVILLGVGDDTQICGLLEKDTEARINDIVRSHCIPEPKFEYIKRQVGENEIAVIKVEEGTDKPYTIWQKGVFIRAESSDRIAERYELDEIYRSKTESDSSYSY